MSQTLLKPAKIRVYNRSQDQLSTGTNTSIELNGMPLKGVTFLKIEIKPHKIAKVTIEMCVSIDDLILDADMRLVGQKCEPEITKVLSEFSSVPLGKLPRGWNE